MEMNHVRRTNQFFACLRISLIPPAEFKLKPHGAVYGQTARSPDLARAVVGVAKTFDIAFMGLAGTCHQTAAEEIGVKFIAGKVLSAYKD